MADITAALEQEAAAIRERIDPKREEIREDEAQLARLEAALEILKGDVALATGTRRAKRAGGSSRSQGGIDEDAITAFVRANQPVSARDIGEQIGVTGNRLSVKLSRMVNAGVLTKTGERRGTRYSVA
jgi:predicted HTH transcriptional regulator